ncbi:MAG TPA: TM2 domain-containing protein [Polyangiaceae bacterium]|jgi:TM2 domain-containing membrane protein YozV
MGDPQDPNDPATGGAAMTAPGDSAMVATLAHGAGLVTRHPRAVGVALVLGGAVVATTSAVFIALLGLSWLLLVLPSVPVLACFVGGGILLTRGARRAGLAGNAELEGRLLALAVAEGGQVTVTGAAVSLGIPLATADEALMRLVRSGHVTAENDTSTGAVLYLFPDIQARQPAHLLPRAPGPAYAPYPYAPPMVHVPKRPMLVPTPHPAAFAYPQGLVRVANRSRVAAAMLAFLLGTFGIHKFYLGRPVAGLLYMLFFWTFIPYLLGLVDFIRLLVMSDHEFELTYNTALELPRLPPPR